MATHKIFLDDKFLVSTQYRPFVFTQREGESDLRMGVKSDSPVILTHTPKGERVTVIFTLPDFGVVADTFLKALQRNHTITVLFPNDERASFIDHEPSTIKSQHDLVPDGELKMTRITFETVLVSE